MESKELFMREAIKEAKKAFENGEIPVGAIIVKDNKIIAKGHNLRETKGQSILHAEIVAIQKACRKLKTWRLNECEMFVTVEPCVMCSGAIIQSRIKKLYIGTMDSKAGACGSVLNLFDYKFNHVVELEKNILQKECETLMKDFFKQLRDKKNINN